MFVPYVSYAQLVQAIRKIRPQIRPEWMPLFTYYKLSAFGLAVCEAK